MNRLAASDPNFITGSSLRDPDASASPLRRSQRQRGSEHGERLVDPQSRFVTVRVEVVAIFLRRRQVAVAQPLLHGPDVHSASQV